MWKLLKIDRMAVRLHANPVLITWKLSTCPHFHMPCYDPGLGGGWRGGGGGQDPAAGVSPTRPRRLGCCLLHTLATIVRKADRKLKILTIEI